MTPDEIDALQKRADRYIAHKDRQAMSDTSPDPKPLTDEELAELSKLPLFAEYDYLSLETAARLLATITTLRASLGEATTNVNTLNELLRRQSGMGQGEIDMAASLERELGEAEKRIEPFKRKCTGCNGRGWIELGSRHQCKSGCNGTGYLPDRRRADTASEGLVAVLREALTDIGALKINKEADNIWTGLAKAQTIAAQALSTTPATRTLGRTPGTNEVCSLCKVPFMGPAKGCGAGVPYHVCPMMSREGGEK